MHISDILSVQIFKAKIAQRGYFLQFSVLAREHQQEDKHNVLKYRNKTYSVDTGQPVLTVLMKKDEKNGVSTQK